MRNRREFRKTGRLISPGSPRQPPGIRESGRWHGIAVGGRMPRNGNLDRPDVNHKKKPDPWQPPANRAAMVPTAESP